MTLVRYARLLLIAALAAAAFTAAVPADAAAKTVPCWKQLINDWFDGRIDRVYPLHCYTEAIANLPADVEAYSDAPDAIRRARQEAIRGGGPGGGGEDPSDPGGTGDNGDGGGGAGGGGGPGGTPEAGGSTAESDDDDGLFSRVLDVIGPKNADSIPLPLLVLAGIALLLLAAAAASFITRRIQARRVPVSGPPPDRPNS